MLTSYTLTDRLLCSSPRLVSNPTYFFQAPLQCVIRPYGTDTALTRNRTDNASWLYGLRPYPYTGTVTSHMNPAALAEYDAATWRLRSRPGPVLLVLMGHRRSTFCHFPRGRQQPRQQAQSNPNSKPPAVIAVSNVDLRSDAATQTRHFESQTSFEITGRWQRDFQCRQIQHFRRRAERSRCVKRGRREDGSPRPTGRD